MTLPVDVQVLSLINDSTADTLDDNTLLSQNTIVPENTNEVYLAIDPTYSLSSLPCPNGCNKGELNYIDEQCYDHIYTLVLVMKIININIVDQNVFKTNVLLQVVPLLMIVKDVIYIKLKKELM